LTAGIVRADQTFTLEWSSGKPQVIVEGKNYTATELTASELRSFRSYDINALYLISLIFLVMLLVLFVITYIQQYMLQYAGQRIIYGIRQELFTHIQRLSLSFFDKNPVGRILTRVTNDIETLNEMYTEVLVNLF